MKLIHVLLLIGLFALIINAGKPSQQIVAPSCFEKEDCRTPIKAGYCGIEYDCVVGKCYSHDILCAEDCGNDIDDDQDGLVDCYDTDCWNNAFCPCSEMDYSTCAIGRCWCPGIKTPRWHVDGSNHYCGCE